MEIKTNFLSLINTLISCGYVSNLMKRRDNDFVILLKNKAKLQTPRPLKYSSTNSVSQNVLRIIEIQNFAY